MKITLADIYPEQQRQKPTLIRQGSVVMLNRDHEEPHELVSACPGEAVFISLVSGRGWVRSLPVADISALTRDEVLVLVGHCPPPGTVGRYMGPALGMVRYIGEARDVVHVDIPDD